MYSAPERLAVLVQDPVGTQGKLLPVRVRESKAEGLIAGLIAIDLVGLNAEKAQRMLLVGSSIHARDLSSNRSIQVTHLNLTGWFHGSATIVVCLIDPIPSALYER